MKERVRALLLVSLALVSLPTAATAEKLQKEDLIRLHLKAIGKDPVRRSRVTEGRGSLKIRVGGWAQLAGPAKLISDVRKLRSSVRFGQP